jgi:hypothetical protein
VTLVAFSIRLIDWLSVLISGREDANRWRNYFERLTHRFSATNFIYIPTLGGPSVSFPPNIKLEINNLGGHLRSEDLAHFIQGTIIPILEDKLQLIERNNNHELTEFLDKMRQLNQYLSLWLTYTYVG